MQIVKFFFGGVLFTFSILAFISWVILPGKFEIKESIIVSSTESKVFETINDLQTWEQWVFERGVGIKPKVEIVSAIIEGAGASMIWMYPEGNRVQVSIKESAPPNKLLVVFTSLESSESSNIEIEISSESNDTRVLWSQKGDYGWSIAARLSASILDFEGETSAIYAAQLKRLKAFVEGKNN